MTTVFIIANFKEGNLVAGWWEVGVFGLLCTLPPLLRRTGHVVFVGNLCMFGGVSSIFWACWYSGALDAPPMLMLMLAPAWAYLGYGKRTAVAWSWIAVAIVAFFFIAERLDIVPDPLGTAEKIQSKRMAEGMLALFFCYLAANIFSGIKDYAVGMLQRRTEELTQMHDRLEHLFGSMTQGVLTFGPDGHIDPSVSSRAQQIFGGESLEGTVLGELLFKGVEDTSGLRDNYDFFVELAFDAPTDDWSELVACAPERIVRVRPDGEEQHLVLEWCPVRDADGTLERIMLVVGDDTERVRIENEAREQDAAHRREVDNLQRMIAGGAHLVLQFLDATTRRIAEVEAGLFEGKANPSGVALALQHVHTVRGEARTFQLIELSDRCKCIELELAPLRSLKADASGILEVPESVQEHIERCKELVTEARQRLSNMSPVGEAVLDQVTVRTSHVRALSDLIETGDAVTDEIRVAMRHLASRPFGESTQQLPRAVAEWAAAHDKRVEVVVEGREEPIPAALGEVLAGAMGHLARNAVAHGVETIEERSSAGKPEKSILRLRCEGVPDGVRIVVEDDGAGLDEAALREAADAAGLPADLSLADLLFSPGLSTANDATEIAGRGMGMAAVRTELEQVGYRVDVVTKVGSGTCVEIHPCQEASALAGSRTSWRVA